MSHVNVLENPETIGIRDAIHVAVVSLRSSADMNPGQAVTWHEKGISVKPCSITDVEIGIVNPFVRGGVGRFENVWIMLFPNSVTGMTHHWSHPDFDEIDLDLDFAKSIVKKTAAALGLYDCESQDTFDYLIELASSYCERPNGCWPHDDYELSSESWENFWKAYSVVTGNPRPTENRAPFRCAC